MYYRDDVSQRCSYVGVNSWREYFQEMGWEFALVNRDDISYKTYDTRRQELWCQANVGHDDWHTYNGWWFAFRNKQDAIWFKIVWG